MHFHSAVLYICIYLLYYYSTTKVASYKCFSQGAMIELKPQKCSTHLALIYILLVFNDR
jgi:hypothetical protein